MKQAVLSLAVATGILAGCSPSVETASKKFNELPPAVQKTVRAQAPESEIANVSSTTQNGQQAYEVTFRQKGGNPRVVVAANGTLLSSELGRTAGTLDRMLAPTGATGTQFSALPEVVQKTILARAPQYRHRQDHPPRRQRARDL